MKDEECNTISLEKSKIVLDAENVKWMIVSVVGIILFISSLNIFIDLDGAIILTSSPIFNFSG